MPIMFRYYEGGVSHKPPLEQLDSKSWAKKKFSEGKPVEIGEFSIASGKWRFSVYTPPVRSGGRKRAIPKSIIISILDAKFPKDSTFFRPVDEIAEITGINEKKIISISKLLKSTYADYVAEWGKKNEIDTSTYRSGRWQK